RALRTSRAGRSGYTLPAHWGMSCHDTNLPRRPSAPRVCFRGCCGRAGDVAGVVRFDPQMARWSVGIVRPEGSFRLMAIIPIDCVEPSRPAEKLGCANHDIDW